VKRFFTATLAKLTLSTRAEVINMVTMPNTAMDMATVNPGKPILQKIDTEKYLDMQKDINTSTPKCVNANIVVNNQQIIQMIIKLIFYEHQHCIDEFYTLSYPTKDPPVSLAPSTIA